jgi:hypothetical protein
VRRAYDGGTTGTLQGVQPLLQGFRRSVVPILGGSGNSIFLRRKINSRGQLLPQLCFAKDSTLSTYSTVTVPVYNRLNVDKKLIKKTVCGDIIVYDWFSLCRNRLTVYPRKILLINPPMGWGSKLGNSDVGRKSSNCNIVS